MKHRYFVLLTFSLLCMSATNCRDRVRADSSMSAAVAGDLTAMVEGCGHQLVSGYTFCRKQEGNPAGNEELVFVAPASKCLGDGPCAEWKLYYPDGSQPIGGQFPKDGTRVSVPWKTILSRDTFELNDGGFWGLRYKIKWIDENGYGKETIMDGEIRLIVHRKGYVSLTGVAEDPAFAWSWLENGTQVKVTTGGRAFVAVRR